MNETLEQYQERVRRDLMLMGITQGDIVLFIMEALRGAYLRGQKNGLEKRLRRIIDVTRT